MFIVALLTLLSTISIYGMTPYKKAEPEKIGNFYYTSHALNRMTERYLSASDIAHTINSGDHYPLSEVKTLCIDPVEQIAVYYNPQNNIVITVMQEATTKWIKSHTKRWASEQDEEPLEQVLVEEELPLYFYKGKSYQDIQDY